MQMKRWVVCLMVMGALAISALTSALAESRLQINLNPVWRFQLGEPAGEPFATNYDDSKWDIVSLPHSLELFPASLAGFAEHGRSVGWYRRELQVPAGWQSKKLFLEFQGAMQTTTVWVNGQKAGDYAVSGYDSFDFDITPYVKAGKNVIAVRVDDRVNPDIPPDGKWLDYILFGGLYRDVFLHVTDPMHLTFPWEAHEAGVRLTLPEVSETQAVVQAESAVRNESAQARQCTLVTEILDRKGKVVQTMTAEREIPAGSATNFIEKSGAIANPHLWSPDDPYLYQVSTIVREGDREVDRRQTSLGIRWTKFDKKQGFFLNGQHVKLVGANVHQAWPFIGNAVPNGLHRRDAEQLKVMGVNWVRLSHYPQDPDFLDALDELGLMALEEPPTWEAQGNEQWMTNLVASFRSMVRRDRNHPSIIIWGTCINHHPADKQLVQTAIEEDPARDRAMDTVWTPMNFGPSQISGGGALAVEHTGHTFPAPRGSRQGTFSVSFSGRDNVFTSVNREYDQVRHQWEQVNAAYLKENNAGLAVWCMYDYNTLRNVNEPGMVWQGVCDLFRIPKFSYWWHVSELTSRPMAYVVRIDGTNAAVFSNCEKVRLWADDGRSFKEVTTQSPDPDFIALRKNRATYALHHPPFHFTVPAEATALKAEGLIGGTVKSTNEWRQFGAPVALTLEADRPAITADGADLSRIIVTAVDANGTPVDTCDASVTFAVKGLGQLIGENPVRLRAGKIIILAQSAFVPGKMTITAQANGLRSANVTVKTDPVPPGVDMPADLSARQPIQQFIR
jgi:beta-galactosidase